MSEEKKDLFNRKKKNSYSFFDDDKHNIKWDKGLTNYSDYLTSKYRNNKADVTTTVNSMFKIMGVDKKINFTTKDTLKSDTIKIPLDLIDDNPDKDQLDNFYGASIRNASHKIFQNGVEYAKHLAKEQEAKAGNLASFVTNLINEERIHKKLSDKYPGYSKFVQKNKDTLYNKAEEWLYEDGDDKDNLLKLITMLIRYPEYISEEMKEKYADFIKQVGRIFNKTGGIPEKFNDVMSIGNSIENCIYEYITREEESPPPPSSGPGDKDKNKGDGGGFSSGSGDGDSEEEPKDEDKEEEKEEDKEEESDSEKEKEEEEKKPAPPKPSAKKNFKKEMEKAVKEAAMALSDDSTGFNEENESAVQEMNYEYTHEDEEKEVIEQLNFIQTHPDKSKYEKRVKDVDLSKAATLQKLLARKVKDYQFNVKSMRSGRLDTNKIAEAAQNVPTIYERIGNCKTNKIVVGLLIDESGSMSSGDAIEKASSAAIFVYEALYKVPNVELFIYGHTADQNSGGDTDIYIYKEPGVSSRYNLGSARARSNNRDGVAILAVAKRIRSFTKNQGVLFVVSDGQPSARDYDHSSTGIRDTKEKVALVESKMDFDVIQIAINNTVRSKDMFKHYIMMDNIKNLPLDLVTYLTKNVNKMIKEKVTF